MFIWPYIAWSANIKNQQNTTSVKKISFFGYMKSAAGYAASFWSLRKSTIPALTKKLTFPMNPIYYKLFILKQGLLPVSARNRDSTMVRSCEEDIMELTSALKLNPLSRGGSPTGEVACSTASVSVAFCKCINRVCFKATQILLYTEAGPFTCEYTIQIGKEKAPMGGRKYQSRQSQKPISS